MAEIHCECGANLHSEEEFVDHMRAEHRGRSTGVVRDELDQSWAKLQNFRVESSDD